MVEIFRCSHQRQQLSLLLDGKILATTFQIGKMFCRTPSLLQHQNREMREEMGVRTHKTQHLAFISHLYVFNIHLDPGVLGRAALDPNRILFPTRDRLRQIGLIAFSWFAPTAFANLSHSALCQRRGREIVCNRASGKEVPFQVESALPIQIKK